MWNKLSYTESTQIPVLRNRNGCLCFPLNTKYLKNFRYRSGLKKNATKNIDSDNT